MSATPALLEYTPWPAVLARLVEISWPPVVDAATEAATRDGSCDQHLVLALLVDEHPPVHAAEAFGHSTGIPIASRAAAELLEWLRTAARLYRHATTVRSSEQQVTAAVERTTTATAEGAPGLVILDDLDYDLRGPLLDLAAEAARLQPAGRLTIASCPLDGAHGVYERRSDGARILLDVASTNDRAGTWAHELAHALDPRAGAVSHQALERFAEELGPLLLEHAPRTLEDAEALIRQSDEARLAMIEHDDLFADLVTVRAFEAIDLAEDSAINPTRRFV